MNEIEMVGMRTLGNTKLLTESRARIGVFASRDTDPAIDIIREQWAMQKGKQRKCVVGTFHSKAECEILYFVLSRGGSAVWFLGCALPERLPHFFKEAVRKKQLLVVSCFNCEHHSYATAHYCRHLADMASNSLVFWSKKEGSSLQPIYERAIASGKRVECF